MEWNDYTSGTRVLKDNINYGKIIMERYGTKGTGPGEFKHPRGVCTSGKDILICD